MVPTVFFVGLLDPDGDTMTYTISFGDGTTTSGTSSSGTSYLSHTYAGPVAPQIVLDVSDGQGGSASSTLYWNVISFGQVYVRTAIDIHPDSGVPATIYMSPDEFRENAVARNQYGLDSVKQPTWAENLWFTDVQGYGTPPGCHVDVSSGRTSGCTAVYQALGWLRVVTDPAVPATISVDGIPRDDWGVWTALAPGTHIVSFGALAGYAAPPDQPVYLVAEQTVTVTAKYVSQTGAPGPDPTTYGLLRVVTKLDDGRVGVPSQIWVQSVARDDWGLNWLKIAPGCYTIRFSDVPGLLKPADVVACVNAGETREVTGTFRVLGFLRVMTDPALGATINVGLYGTITRPFNDWGLWLAMPPGTYYVAFGAVQGWREPGVATAIVTAGTTTVLVGHYTPVT
jgi:hypothetical protein